MLDLLLHSAVLYLANVDGLHEVPESVAALVTEENSPGRSQVLTGHHGVAQVLLLSRNLEQLPVLQVLLLYPQSDQLVHQILPRLTGDLGLQDCPLDSIYGLLDVFQLQGAGTG